MNTIRQSNPTRVTVPAGMSELVRGSEAMLVAKLAPMVRQRDVALDLKPVRRIDAAGIAALISLYHCAHESGHTFSVYNVLERIDEILRLVGLEAILVSHEEVADRPETSVECHAA